MNIKLHSANFEITGAINDYVFKKIPSLSKFLDTPDVLCEVELGKTTNHHRSGDIFKAEINMLSGGRNQFYAVAEESDVYTAIDIVRDQIERAIISKKTKQETLFRRGAGKIKSMLKRLYRN